MAQDRFYFWRGYYDALATLPTDAQRGRFVMAMCQYAFSGELPDLSDDPVLAFAWVVVRDQVAESVEIGRKQAERGSRGGRPRGTRKSGAEATAETTDKSGALSTDKTTALSGAKSGALSVRYGNVPSDGAASLDAQPPAATERAEEPQPPSFDLTPEEARAEVLRLMAEGGTVPSGD